MKEILRLLIFFLGITSTYATDVLFNLPDFNANPATNRVVTLQAQSPFIGNLWFTNTGPTNAFWYSNFPPFVLWNGVIKAPPAAINFQIYVNGSNLGGLSATNFTSVGNISTYPAGAVAPSWQAAYATFQLSGTTLSNTFYPLFANPSNYVSLQVATNMIGVLANTNGYIPGLNVTLTTNGGVVTIAATGSGAATNAIVIQGGSGNNNTLTNPTFLGSITATNLGSAAFVSTGALTNNLSTTNYVNTTSNLTLQASTNLAGLIAQSLTNGFTSAGITNSLASITFAESLTNGLTSPGITNGLASTQALTAATNQSQQNLIGTNSSLLADIVSSTNIVNLSGGYSAIIGNTFNTNTLLVANSVSSAVNFTFTWNGSKYTNSGGTPTLYITNSFAGNGVWTLADLGGGDWYTNSSTASPQTPLGHYKSPNSGFAADVFYNGLTLFAYQPSASNLTNWSTLNTNIIGTYWPTMVQLGTASNALQSQITTAGISAATATNISSNIVQVATNIVYQSGTNTAGSISVSITQAATNTLYQSDTNMAGAIASSLVLAGTNNLLSQIKSSISISNLTVVSNFVLGAMTVQRGAPTNIIGTDFGIDGNGEWILSAANTWTNNIDSRYTQNLSAGNLTINSNGVQLYTVPYVNFPTNYSVGTFGAAPAPAGWYGLTNQENGQIHSGNPKFTGNPVFSGGTFRGDGTALTNTSGITVPSNPATLVNSGQAGIIASNTVAGPFTNNGVVYQTDFTGSWGSNILTGAFGGWDTNRYLIGNAVTQMITNATALAQGVVATNIPASSLYSSNSAQLGGNPPSYYAPSSNSIPVLFDLTGAGTLQTNVPIVFPGGVGFGVNTNMVFVASGRVAYTSWFTNSTTSPWSYISTLNAGRYLTNEINSVSSAGWTLGGAPNGGFPGGAATNLILFGSYPTNQDATASNTIVTPLILGSDGGYSIVCTGAPPPISGIPVGDYIKQNSNGTLFYFFNQAGSLVFAHTP